MFCSECGSQLKPGAKFCVKCGAPVQYESPCKADIIVSPPAGQPVFPNLNQGNQAAVSPAYTQMKPADAKPAVFGLFDLGNLLKSKILLGAMLLSVLPIVFTFVRLVDFQWNVSYTTDPVLESWTLLSWFANSNYPWLGYAYLGLLVLFMFAAIFLAACNHQKISAVIYLFSGFVSAVFLILLAKDIITFKNAITDAIGTAGLSVWFYVFAATVILFLAVSLLSLFSLGSYSAAAKEKNRIMFTGNARGRER